MSLTADKSTSAGKRLRLLSVSARTGTFGDGTKNADTATAENNKPRTSTNESAFLICFFILVLLSTKKPAVLPNMRV